MSRDDLYLGIDTSNYTTSICAVNEVGEIFYEDRKLLLVTPGTHGLKQSEAMFQHLTRLPERLDVLQDAITGKIIRAVGVSVKPRPRPGSYMPVFLPGILAARAIATGAKASVWETTHQEGHLAAAEASAEGFVPDDTPYLVFHLSGGTTDLLWVKKNHNGYIIRELYTSLDLHVGQFIDRIGVLMGFSFPAGKELEEAALRAEGQVPILPSAVKQGNPSFSGPLTAATKLYEQGIPRELVAAAVLRTVANTLEKSIRYAFAQTNLDRVLFVGGVASNQLVKERLQHRFGESNSFKNKLYFCAPKYASDNAFGVALIAQLMENS